MAEPIYEFVKGEGWVVRNTESAVVTMRCGTVVRIEKRTPQRGEYYCWKSYDSWTMEGWANWVKGEYLMDIPKYRHSGNRLGADHITVVVLSQRA